MMRDFIHPLACGGRGRRILPAGLVAVLVLCGACSFAAAGPTGSLPAGERFRVTSTRRLGPVLGYGEPMARDAAPAHIAAPEAGGDILWGADIGLPVTVQVPGEGGVPTPVTFLFFGDTDQLDHAVLADRGWVQPHEPASEDEVRTPWGLLQGDAIGWTTDRDPDDGLALDHVLRNLEPGAPERACASVEDQGFRVMYVPGVHPDPCAAALRLDDGNLLWFFNTPTGAWAMDDGTLLVMVADQTPYDGIPQASSYLAASTDGGLTWTALNGGRPFSSAEVSGWPLSKFVHVDALFVDAADYQDPGRSGPCLLPLPDGEDTRGWLLFGGGLWTQSDVYLAFLSRSDLAAAVADPSRSLHPWYFSGETESGCWSTDQRDAYPVVNAFDNTSFARLETPCGHRVIQDTVGVGYVSVTRLAGTLSGGREVDRLAMVFNSGYLVCTAGEGDQCCGGSLREDGMCDGADLDRYADRLVEGNTGIVLITGETWRPWIWNTTAGPADHDGTPLAMEGRPLVPLIIPPDPAANWYGAGPECQAVLTGGDVITGYAPLLVDTFTRVAPDGGGFDLFFLLSRWGAKLTPDDPGSADEGYHYQVDLFRTRLVPGSPEPVRRPAGRAVPAGRGGRAAQGLPEGGRGAAGGGEIR